MLQYYYKESTLSAFQRRRRRRKNDLLPKCCSSFISSLLLHLTIPAGQQRERGEMEARFLRAFVTAALSLSHTTCVCEEGVWGGESNQSFETHQHLPHPPGGERERERCARLCRCHTRVNPLWIPLVYAPTPGGSTGDPQGICSSVTPA